MMFKEYISATAEFLIIKQVRMAENAGIFPRENELPVCSSVLTLSSPPGTRQSYRTPQAVTELLAGLGTAGDSSCHTSGRQWHGHTPGLVMTSLVSSRGWSWSPEQNWGSANTFTLGFHIPSLGESCLLLVCHASHVSHLSCDTLELLLLQTEIYFPSHKFIQLLFKARLHSHALLLHFLTDLVCSPRISSLGWFKGSTSPFPCEITQRCSLASIPCCCVRAAPGPSQPLPCSLNEPISIPSFVYGHPIPLLLTIFLYACFSCEFTFL